MAESPVADLHRLDGDIDLGGIGIYMAFINCEGEVRKGHEIFNNY